MQYSYDNLYLNKARTALAHMLDYAVHDLRQDPAVFFDLFMSTGIANQFGSGDYRVITGMSGVELAYKVLADSGINIEKVSYRYTSGRSKEYWAGWALANYQWETGRPFADIIAAMPVRNIIAVCDELRSSEIREISSHLSWMDNLKVPDHMSQTSYAEFRARLDSAIEAHRSASGQVTRLKRLRLQSSLSQSQLAALSGVPVRTIQQYEQRQKDINKAAFESIIKLAAALSCEPAQLLERN